MTNGGHISDQGAAVRRRHSPKRQLAGPVLLALSTLTLGAAVPQGESSYGPADDDVTAIAVESYARERSVGIRTAERAVADQRALVEEINRVGVDLGVDADVWVERSGGRQTISVRSADPKIRRALSALVLSEESDVRLLDGPAL